MQKIYKRDNTGKVRVWWIEVNGSRFRSHAGQVDGEIVTSEWTQCEGKNVGRSNASTPDVQVRSEADALYTKKLKRGYTKDLEKIDEAKKALIGVMLAHKYEDHKHKFLWKRPLYSQPKLDGIRCIATPHGLWTRKGEPIFTVPHIAAQIIPLCVKKQMTFDGELYNHSLRDDFNEIASLVRRQKQSPEHAAKVRDIVQYHIYDQIDHNTCFIDRWRKANDVIERYLNNDDFVVVDTDECLNQYSLDNRYEEYLENGYEGQMIRTDTLYENKRTTALLKRKEFQDEEFEIIDMVEGKGNRSGMVGAIVLAIDGYLTREDGTKVKIKNFQAALMGSNEYRRRIWKEHLKNPFSGVSATVKYFHKTPGGVPRFPVVKSIDEGK